MKHSPTPILDLEKPVRLPQDGVTVKGMLKAVPAALAVIAIFGFGMWFILRCIFSSDLLIPSWLADFFAPILQTMETLFDHGVILVLASLGVMYGVTLVHEAGHALAAVALKWPIREYRVAPFSIKKDNDGWKVRVSSKLWPGAMVAAEPLPFARYHRKERVFALGGSAANLISGAFVVVFCSGPPFLPFFALCRLFVLWSFFIGIANLFPVHVRGLELDGYSAFMVSRSPSLLAARIASMRLRTQALSSKSVACLNRRWLALAESLGSVSQHNKSGLWLAYCYWLDQRQLDRAAGLLEKMLRGCNNGDLPYRALIFAECAVLSSFRGNSEAALTWSARTDGLHLPEYLRRRANTYVAWSRGDKGKALREALAARQAAASTDDTGRERLLSAWDRTIEAIETTNPSELMNRKSGETPVIL